MGYRIIAERAGLAARWRGYLANLTPSEFRESFAPHVPSRLRGSEFLARYGGTTDPVAPVEPAREYDVLVPTTHPIEENARVRAFAELLAAPAEEGRAARLGALMYESHASYSRCGLGADGTDRLVALVRASGAGLWGAKITGGGSGGTVAVLGRRDAGPAVTETADRYARETGRTPLVFSGSSPGAAAFGHLCLRLE